MFFSLLLKYSKCESLLTMKLLSLKRERLIRDELMDAFQQSSLGNGSDSWTEGYLHTLTPSAKWSASLCFQFGVQLDGWGFCIVKCACLIIIFHWPQCLFLRIYISWKHRLLITRVWCGLSRAWAFVIYFRISKEWILLYFLIPNFRKSNWRDNNWQAWLPSSWSVNDTCYTQPLMYC